MKDRLLNIGRAAALTTAIGLSACGDGPDSTVQPTEITLGSNIQGNILAQEYSNELNKLGPVKTLDIAGLAIPTVLYNASAFDVNTQAVKNTYLFLEKISKTPVQVSSFKKPNGEDRISFFVVRDSTKRDMFVIDPSKPRPNWSKLTSDASISSGASFTNPKEVQSFVSVDPAIERAYKSPAESISAVFLTEACQSTIEAFVMDPKTKTIDPDHQLKLREQEYICNSFSIAMFAKMQGLDYAGYLEYAGQQFITAPGVGLVGAKPSAIPVSIYSSMPTNLQALK